jgi:hypothetical protein
MERGNIKKKHEKLAKMLRKDATWEQVKRYISVYRKYDNWTLRDIDIVIKILKTK